MIQKGKKEKEIIISLTGYRPINEDEKIAFIKEHDLEGEELTYQKRKNIINLLDWLKEKGFSLARIKIGDENMVSLEIIADSGAIIQLGTFVIETNLKDAFKKQLADTMIEITTHLLKD